jgi:hypothetical protein
MKLFHLLLFKGVSVIEEAEMWRRGRSARFLYNQNLILLQENREESIRRESVETSG